MSIDHIGIAVESIDEQIKYYQDLLGYKVEGIEDVESQGVRVCFINTGNVHIELLEPLNDESPIKKFLEKKGQGIHHIAYSVKNIESSVKLLKDNGHNFLSENPKLGAGNKQIIFLHPKSSYGVLTELCMGATKHD